MKKLFQPKSPEYTASLCKLGGWLIFENGRSIAYCENESTARGICQALNLARVLLSAGRGRAMTPAGIYLN